MSTLFFLVTTTLLLVFTPGRLLACTCSPIPPPDEAVERNAVVVAGRVVEILEVADGTSLPGFPQVTLAVSAAWKGDLARSAVFGTWGTCGFGFELGETYMVYTAPNLHAHICTRTGRLSSATEDLEYLGDPLVTYSANETEDLRSVPRIVGM